MQVVPEAVMLVIEFPEAVTHLLLCTVPCRTYILILKPQKTPVRVQARYMCMGM